MSERSIKIGDVLPIAVPIDRKVRAAIAFGKVRRGKIERAAGSSAINQDTSRARLIIEGHREAAARLADPIEQAKDHLRRERITVYSGRVHGHPPGTFVVGSVLRSTEQVLALAERKGWKRPAGFAANDDQTPDMRTRVTSLSLHEQIEAYLRRTGMKATTFGHLACGYGGFVKKLREGSQSRPVTVAKVTAFLARAEAE